VLAFLMLSKSIQRKLTLYFSAMVVIHGYVLWQMRQSIPAGLPDFSIFYTAGRVLETAGGSRLYDEDLEERLQRSFSPQAVERRGSILPYNHPPFEALIFVPLVHFSYLTAYLLWLAINLIVLFITLALLRRHLARLGSAPFWLWALASLAFAPIFIALVQGQDSILLLFCCSMAFVMLHKNWVLSAGSLLGAGVYKYHLVLPLVVALAWRRRLLSGFLMVALFLAGLSLSITGWHSLVAYPRYVWQSEHNSTYVWNQTTANTANLRGLISALLPTHPRLKLASLVTSSMLLFGAMLYLSRKIVGAGPARISMVVALDLIATLLLSYHVYIHDLSLLFLAIVLVFENLLTGGAVSPWAERTLRTSMALLFCSPVYLVLALHYAQLQALAVVLLVFFVAGLKQLTWSAGRTSASISVPA
jgi:Glycosyltransferase family 87